MKYKVSIKEKGFDRTYIVPAPNSLDAYAWGEKQAQHIGRPDALVQVLGEAVEEEE